MKTRLLFLTVLLLGCSLTVVQSQTNFQWEKVDSINKTKAQIYSDTKMFIAEYWKSAQNVIQNDDKEAGMVLIKGTTKVFLKSLYLRTYVYSYSVKFYMKEKKHKIVIDNVNCISADYGGTEWPLIQPVENATKRTGGLSVSNVNELMGLLKINLQGIIDNYSKYIKNPTPSNDGW